MLYELNQITNTTKMIKPIMQMTLTQLSKLVSPLDPPIPPFGSVVIKTENGMHNL